MCEGDLQNMEYMIRMAMLSILNDEEVDALSYLVQCLEKIKEYL